MEIEQYLHRLEGRLDALTHICAAVIATHPLRDQMRGAIERQAARAQPLCTGTANQQAYAAGIDTVVQEFRVALAVAEAAQATASTAPLSRN